MRAMADGNQPEDPAYAAKVLRAFIRADRLVSLPARERKKQVVLRYLLERVLPDDREVEERELNARLAAWHPDVAALRRYLVDAGLATRTGMAYRRADRSDGGPPVAESPRPAGKPRPAV
jgi:hypothetical protein